MKLRLSALLIFGAALLSLAWATTRDSHSHTSSYDSAELKIAHLQQNAIQPMPNQSPTVLTTDELNAFFNEGGVDLPPGVQGVRFTSKPAVLTGETRVDFDRLASGKRVSSPLMSFFVGTHDVTVVAQASGAGGRASVKVDSVEIDGVRVPRPALEFFVEHYLQPRFGSDVGLDSTFSLPERIDMAIVGKNSVSITQR